MSDLSAISLKTIAGAETSLAEHDGKVLLVVNVASQCGLTPQYEGLEALHGKLSGQGFSVLGFPANDFGAQEPGSNAEIAEFCSAKFGVSFPMHEKIQVTGEGKHPLYAALTSARPAHDNDTAGFRGMLASHGMSANPEPEVLWNFEKFLIARDGQVVARFAPGIAPDDPELTAAIEAELAR